MGCHRVGRRWAYGLVLLLVGTMLAGCGGGSDAPQTQVTGRTAQRAVAVAAYQAHRLALEAGWYALAQTAPGGFRLPDGVTAGGFSWLTPTPHTPANPSWRVELFTDASRRTRAGTLTFDLPSGARPQTGAGAPTWHYPAYPATARLRVDITAGRRPLSGEVRITWRGANGAYDLAGSLRAPQEGLVLSLRQNGTSDGRVSLGTVARFGGIVVTPDLKPIGSGDELRGPVRVYPFGWAGTLEVSPRPDRPYHLSLTAPGSLSAVLSPAADSLLITYSDGGTQRVNAPFWHVWSR